jgi:predicted dehydrogenase
MRIALVGLGNAGYTLHLPALEGLPSVSVVGAADTDSTMRDRAGERFGIPTFADFGEMLGRTSPNIVIVGTPPETHADYCIRSVEAGAHVICEKPFASSVNEADEIVAAADAAGRHVALNHEFREMPIYRALRDQVGRQEVGNLVFAQVWQNMDLPPWKEPGWRGQMLQRTLYEAGVHLVDFLMALFGEQPRSVFASVSSCGVRETDSDAVALATLEFSGGRLAQIVQNRLCRGETQYFEVRAECTDASLRASFGGRARVTAGLFRSTRPHIRMEFGTSGMAWSERGGRRRFLARNPKEPGMIATRNVFERTLQAFADGSRPPASAEDGRKGLEVIAAAYHSAQTGKRVTIDGPESGALAGLRMGAHPDR